MASLFDPLSVALETVKTIEGVRSHKLDPPRFRVRVPVNPGEWAKKEAFQRQHDLRKWNIFHAKILVRTGIKLPKISTPESVVSTQSLEDQKEEKPVAEEKIVRISSEITETVTTDSHREEEDEEYETTYAEEEDEEEAQKIAKMTSNQIHYYNACMTFKVTINRKVLRCIDTNELVLNLMKMTDPEFKAIMTALVTLSRNAPPDLDTPTLRPIHNHTIMDKDFDAICERPLEMYKYKNCLFMKLRKAIPS